MAYGIRLHIWGEYACFTRPEMKVERVSYDVITPSAARGILEAIYWKPAILWVVDRIHVLHPIRFETIRRNELGGKISASKISGAMRRNTTDDLCTFVEDDRQQRAATVLRDVGYVIEAHYEMTDGAGAEEHPGKHISIFNRRAEAGQCFHQPCMGTREFPVAFALLPEGAALPVSNLSDNERNRDFGWMLHDIDFAVDKSPRFFRAEMKNGMIEVPPWQSEGVKA